MDDQYILEHEFFSDLTKDQMNSILEYSGEILLPVGEFLFREGDYADRFYLVHTGAVAIGREESGLWKHRHLLQPGDVLGWSWIVPPYQWFFNAKAEEECRLFEFDAIALKVLCEQDAAFGYALLKRFAAMMGQRLMANHDLGIDSGRDVSRYGKPSSSAEEAQTHSQTRKSTLGI